MAVDVDKLAEYLVGLRDQTQLCLTNLQARQIIELWENMDKGDKQRIDYAARHQDSWLVENIFIRLCALHPSPKKKGKGAVLRWSLILRDYHKIRELVLSNARVMEGTEIQIVEVDQTTLIQWHNNRQKRQELSVLLQGTALPPYKRTVQANTCKKCGKFRTAETGHSQFRGRVYCPNFEALTKEQWLEEMRKSK